MCTSEAHYLTLFSCCEKNLVKITSSNYHSKSFFTQVTRGALEKQVTRGALEKR
jgi:hypothetical protein